MVDELSIPLGSKRGILHLGSFKDKRVERYVIEFDPASSPDQINVI